MLSDSLVGAAVAVARREGVRPAGFLALIEVETSGNPFEPDGRVPRFLFERHKFYSELKARAPGKLAKAVAAGLAIPAWSPKTQYKDQRDAAGRAAVLARAIAIDAECAHRACSWGLGQIMGFEAEHLGYPGAIAMVTAMRAGIEAQLEAIVRFLRYKHIVQVLNEAAHAAVAAETDNYATVALRYNGRQYAQHNYHGRLADADKRWERRLATLGVDVAADLPAPARPVPPEQLLGVAQIKEVQRLLRSLGFAMVGAIDGQWGPATIGAISAFQAHEGLPVTGHYDDATRDALAVAEPKPVSRERETATADDLAEAGSKTIVLARQQSFIGKAMAWLGLGGTAGGVAEQTGTLDRVRDLTDQAGTAREILTSVKSFMPSPTMIVVCVVVVGLGIGVALIARAIVRRRVADHNSGVHAGSGA